MWSMYLMANTEIKEEDIKNVIESANAGEHQRWTTEGFGWGGIVDIDKPKREWLRLSGNDKSRDNAKIIANWMCMSLPEYEMKMGRIL